MEKPSPTSAWIAFAVLFAASALLLGAVLFPLWKPLFMGAVLAAALQPLADRVAVRLRGRRGLAAVVVVVALLVLVLMPLVVLGGFAVREITTGVAFVRQALQGGGLAAVQRLLPPSLESWVAQAIAWIPDTDTLTQQAATGGTAVARWLSGLLFTLSQLTFNVVIMLVVLYLLLVEGRRLVAWLEAVSPLRGQQTLGLLREFRQVSRSVLGSAIATAAAQAVIATTGYLIARVPHAAFFGLATFFAAFIPGVGTALVALPLGALVLLTGHPWAAAFLWAWSLGVVSTVDTLLKPILIRWGGMELNGALVFLSLIGGVMLFGGPGLLLGPLSVSFFLTMVRMGRELTVSGDPPARPPSS